jgi:hypothetical protein
MPYYDISIHQKAYGRDYHIETDMIFAPDMKEARRQAKEMVNYYKKKHLGTITYYIEKVRR